jgi:hypothetical protein
LVYKKEQTPRKSMTYGAFFVIIILVEFMDGSLIGGGAYDFFVGKTSQNMKGKEF